jgi:hypothetical protein
LINQKKEITPYNYRGLPATGNELYNWSGWLQRQEVEVNGSLNMIDNKEIIGINKRVETGPRADGSAQWYLAEHHWKYRAIIYQGDFNHMQSTPMTRRGFWQIIVENTGFYRSNAMHWSRNTDNAFRNWGNRYEMAFNDINTAISIAEGKGWGIDVVYPHERYHSQKAYADNFTYVKEEISDLEEDEVFDSIADKI